MRPLLTTMAALAICATSFAEADVKPVKVAAERAPTNDEDLAIAALEGLMAQSDERALPIIKKVLAGSQTTLVKRRALFVLSQIEAPEALQILSQTARSSNTALRNEAIRAIGINGDAKAVEGLREVYDVGDDGVKNDVLHAWLIAQRKDLVFQIASTAKSEKEAGAAVRILGAMGAKDELRKLADRPDSTRGLAHAFAISGDLASLRKIAEGTGELSVRVEATQSIGIIHGDAARAALREIYTRSTEREIKAAAVHGMMIASDEEGVLALYKAATSSDEKRMLMRTLSTMDGDAALKAIDAALEGGK
jgi:HEAT repeat protein